MLWSCPYDEFYKKKKNVLNFEIQVLEQRLWDGNGNILGLQLISL